MKSLLYSLSFLFIPVITLAQKDEEIAPLRLGLKIGAAQTKMSYHLNDTLTKYQDRIGLQIGGLFELPLSSSLGLQTELFYNQTKATRTANTKEETITVDYLCIPLLVKYYARRTGLSIFSGIQISMKVSSADSTDLFSYKSREFSVKGGIEYYFRNNLLVQAGYQHGLTDITKSLREGSVTYDQIFFTIGIKFPQE